MSPALLSYYIYILGNIIIVLAVLFLGPALAKEKKIKLNKLFEEYGVVDLETERIKRGNRLR